MRWHECAAVQDTAGGAAPEDRDQLSSRGRASLPKKSLLRVGVNLGWVVEEGEWGVQALVAILSQSGHELRQQLTLPPALAPPTHRGRRAPLVVTSTRVFLTKNCPEAPVFMY